MILDLGCGNRKEHWLPNSHGLDKFDFGQKYIIDLESLNQWQIQSNTYDGCAAYHILEHIRSPEAFIHILNEVWRVTKAGGVFEGAAPHYIYSPNYTRDPFHVRNISQHTFDAFLENSTIHFNDYGVKCKFRVIKLGINANSDVFWELEVVK